MKPVRRSGTYSIPQLVSVARAVGAQEPSEHPWIAARRTRFLEAVAPISGPSEPQGPPPLTTVRDAHVSTTRAWQHVSEILTRLSKLPGPAGEDAKRVLERCMPRGLAFTQTPSEQQREATREGLARFDSVELSPLFREAGLILALDRVRNALVAHDEAASRRSPPSTNARSLRRANSELHRYARLVQECAGVELEPEEAERLLSPLSVD